MLKTPEDIAKEEEERQQKLVEKKEKQMQPENRGRRFIALVSKSLELAEAVAAEVPKNSSRSKLCKC